MKSLLICPNCLYLIKLNSGTIKCPECNTIIETHLINKPEMPSSIDNTHINMLGKEVLLRIKGKVVDTKRDHDYFLDPAIIIQVDYQFFRIKFYDNKTLWVPTEWVTEFIS